MNFDRVEKILGILFISLFILIIVMSNTLAYHTCNNNFINNNNPVPIIGMANPAAVYCEELGYTYKIIKEDKGEQGVCVFSKNGAKNGVECDAWDFLEGKCGREYSYCAKQGYDIETVSDGKNPFSSEYAVCIPKVNSTGSVSTSSKKGIAVTDLFKLGEKIHSSSLKLEKPKINLTWEGSTQYKIKTTESLPTGFDWRNKDSKNWLTTVKDQGGCGSCWAFSAVGVVESVHKIFENNSKLDLDLSEEYLVSDCSNAGSCCGGWHYEALDFIKDSGITDEGCFPYADNTCSCSGSPCVVEVTLYQSNITNSENILNSLRVFRDKRLKTEYVKLYYEYSPDIKKILIDEPSLLVEFAGLIVKYMPAIRYATGDKNGKDLYISEKDVQRIVSFVEKLKIKIEKRREKIGRARSSELIKSLEEFEEQVSTFGGKKFSKSFQDSIYFTHGNVDTNLAEQTPTCNCKYSDISSDSNVCSDVTCSDKCSNWSDRLWKIENWGYVPNTREDIKNYLIEKGPLSVAMGFGDGYGGYWDGDIYGCNDSGMNHAVVIVGYNDTGGYWIVRNSWGPYWEKGGYFKVGYGECSIEEEVYYASLIKTTEGYCPASTKNANYEKIIRVALNDAEKLSENSTLRDFTDTVFTTLNIGKTYTLYVDGYTNATYTEYVKAWIDFNNDKKFDVSEEIYLGNATFNGIRTFSKNFTVPINTKISETRMRIYLKWNSVPSPCENATYGEVEDYKINIINDTTPPYLWVSNYSINYVKVGDPVVINAYVYDESKISYVYAEIESPDENIISSIQLYDDGMHNDSSANDSIYGNSWITSEDSKDYYIDFIVADMVGNTQVYNNTYRFTTWNISTTTTTTTIPTKTMSGFGAVKPLDWSLGAGECNDYIVLLNGEGVKITLMKINITEDCSCEVTSNIDGKTIEADDTLKIPTVDTNLCGTAGNLGSTYRVVLTIFFNKTLGEVTQQHQSVGTLRGVWECVSSTTTSTITTTTSITTTTTTSLTTTTSTTSTTTSTTTTSTLAGCSVKGDKSPCDGKVSDFELLNYIDQWAKNEVSDFDLLAAIDKWAKG